MRNSILLLAVSSWLAACGGDDWGSVSGPDSSSSQNQLIDVWAFSPTDVWFLDGSATVYRYDGADWTTLDTPSTGGLACIFALSPTQVWLCAGEEVLFYDGTDFTASDVTTPTGLAGLTDIWASSPSDLWVVGDDAIAAHYDGSDWSQTIVGSPFKSSVWGSGPDDVYALSTFDLFHYDGSEWTEIDLEAGAGEGQVWGTGAADVWVMTDSSEVSHYDGSEWQAIYNDDFVGEMAAVWGPAPDDLWAAGTPGTIAHYDGESWHEVSHQKIGAPYLQQLVAVHGSGANDVWAVGYQLGEGGSSALIFHHQ